MRVSLLKGRGHSHLHHSSHSPEKAVRRSDESLPVFRRLLPAACLGRCWKQKLFTGCRWGSEIKKNKPHGTPWGLFQNSEAAGMRGAFRARAHPFPVYGISARMHPNFCKKRAKAAWPCVVCLNTPVCSRHVSNFAPISCRTAACAFSGGMAVPYFRTSSSTQGACSGAGGLYRICLLPARQNARYHGALLFQPPGQDGKAHHLDKADVLFLMWCISGCGWKIPSGYSGVVRLLRSTRSNTYCFSSAS